MQKICIIIPCYNESSRLDLNVFIRYLQSYDYVHFYFVDDGSTDDTRSILSQILRQFPDRVTCLFSKHNFGKADAVRRGVLAAVKQNCTELIGFFDADLSAPLSQIPYLMNTFVTHPECRMVMGSRLRCMGVRIVRRPLRHYLGRLFSTAISIVLDLPVYDTQCGAKLLRADTAERLFKKPFLSRWIFDCELLFRMMHFYGKYATLRSVIEVPLEEWIEKRGSRLTVASLIRVPVDIVRIGVFYRFVKR